MHGAVLVMGGALALSVVLGGLGLGCGDSAEGDRRGPAPSADAGGVDLGVPAADLGPSRDLALASDLSAPTDLGRAPSDALPDSGTASDAGPVSDGGADLAVADSGGPALDLGGGAPGKVLHYRTDFVDPRVVLSDGRTLPLLPERDAWVRAVDLGPAGAELRFSLRDAADGREDHPPGGGTYRMAADLDEAWLDRGTLFDVDPDTLDLDLIDAHTHPLARQGGGFVYDPAPLVGQLAQRGFQRALTSQEGPIEWQRSVVGDLCRNNPILVPLVWVDPTSQTAAEVEPLLRDAGFRGLKVHPVVDDFPADDARMDPLCVLAARYQVPVQLHSSTDDVASPSRIAALARRHPTVAFVMVHTELGALDKGPALATIRDLPNVYAETSWVGPDSILQILDTLDSSRCLLGTDATVDGWQMYTNRSIPDANGNYVYTVPAAIEEVRRRAHPGAFANWSHLTAIRLYDLRFGASEP